MSAIPNMIADSVPDDASGTSEIGFAVPARYNASRILFDNMAANRGDKLAVTGPSGQRTYAELCADASRWGQGLRNLGLQRGDRILMFLDDTPSYPAAFFGAVRAGLVPLLINTLTPPDLLQFYLADSGATTAVVDAESSDRFSQVACSGTQLQTLIIVNGSPQPNAVPRCLTANRGCRPFPIVLRKLIRIATKWLSGCIPRDPPDGRRASFICSMIWLTQIGRSPSMCLSHLRLTSASRYLKCSLPTVSVTP